MSWASRHNLLARAVNSNLGGVSVTAGAASASGILEKNAQLVIDGQAIDTNYLLSNIPTSLFGNLTFGDPITVAGEPYTVREPMPVGDGAFMMVSLERVTEAWTGTAIGTLSGLQLITLDGRYLVTQ